MGLILLRHYLELLVTNENLNKKQIISLMKIKSPFLMIDKIKNIIDLKSSLGIKKINKILGSLNVTS